MNAELSRLVAGGRHHAAGGRIADGDRQGRDCRAVRPMRRRHPCSHARFCAAARCLRRLSWPSLHQDNLYRPDMGSARRICHPTAFVWARSPSPCAGGSQRRSCQRQTLSPTACAQARVGDDMGTDEFDDRLPAILQFRGQIVHWLPWAHAKNSHSRHRFESVGGILRRALSLNFRAPHAHRLMFALRTNTEHIAPSQAENGLP